jgi:hypothetical protein
MAKRAARIGDLVCITWEDITEVTEWSDEEDKHELLSYKSYGVLTHTPTDDRNLYEIIGDDPQNGGKQGRKQLFPAGAVLSIERL